VQQGGKEMKGRTSWKKGGIPPYKQGMGDSVQQLVGMVSWWEYFTGAPSLMFVLSCCD
jgi:hypothetical protein